MADYNLDHIPGAGWVLDDQGRPVLDVGGDVLHGSGLLSGLLHNYNHPIAQDVVSTNQEQGPSLSDVPSLLHEQAYGAGTYIKDHPGEILAGLASPELSVPASLAAGLGGYLFDSMHPFSSQAPDYQTMRPRDYIANGLAAAALNAVPGLGESKEITDAGLKSAIGDASDFANREVIPETETAMKTGFVGPTAKSDAGFNPWPAPPSNSVVVVAPNLNIGPKPKVIPSEDIGGVPGYHVLNYDAIPGASDIEKQLADEGKPRFVASSETTNPFFDDYLVGNYPYSTDARTPEGKLFAARSSDNSPLIPDKLYKGWNPKEFDPNYISDHLRHNDNPNDDDFLHGAEELDYYQDPETGVWYKQPWLSNRPIGAESYSHPILETPQWGDAIKAAIASGKITEKNLPKTFESLGELQDWADTYKPYKMSDIQTVYNNILQGDPRLQGSYATVVPFVKNPKIIDKAGHGWHEALPSEEEYVPNMPFEQGGHAYQNMQIENARKQGHDALVYKNQVDPGTLNDQVWQHADPERYGQAILPQNVHVVFSPRDVNYPESYMWRRAMRPLAVTPMAAGLGAYMLHQQQKDKP